MNKDERVKLISQVAASLYASEKNDIVKAVYIALRIIKLAENTVTVGGFELLYGKKDKKLVNEKEIALEMIDKCIGAVKYRRDMPGYNDAYKQCAKDILIALEASRNRVERGELFNPTSEAF